jgi:hypothetical protein
MHRDIVLQMADGSEQSFSFVANGATSLRFRMVFGRELLASITNIINAIGIENISSLMATATNLQEKGETEIGLDDLSPDQMKAMISIVGSGEISTVSQLAYIMNASAERKDMRSLDVENYLDWLEQFETMEFLTHAMDFIMLYMNNRITSSTQKKKEDRLIER